MTCHAAVFESAFVPAIEGGSALVQFYNQYSDIVLIVPSGSLFPSTFGTSSAMPISEESHGYVVEAEPTSGGIEWNEDDSNTTEAEATRQAVSELRLLSGLTWDQLGKLFNVSRRSLHFWASGKPLNAPNEQRLMQVLDVVRTANQGSAAATRAALFEVKEQTTAFDLLAAQQFDSARRILSTRHSQARPQLRELSAAAKASRMPLRPEELIDAEHGPDQHRRTEARPARTVRDNRRGSP